MRPKTTFPCSTVVSTALELTPNMVNFVFSGRFRLVPVSSVGFGQFQYNVGPQKNTAMHTVTFQSVTHKLQHSITTAQYNSRILSYKVKVWQVALHQHCMEVV